MMRDAQFLLSLADADIIPAHRRRPLYAADYDGRKHE